MPVLTRWWTATNKPRFQARVTHYTEGLPKALWASVYPSVKWDDGVPLKVRWRNIVNYYLFPIPGEAENRGLETLEYSHQIKHKTPS